MKQTESHSPLPITAEQFHSKFPRQLEINSDCAVDYGCPVCGSRGPFRVEVRDFVTLSDDGGYSFPDELQETERDPRCLECGYSGPGFHIDGLDEFLAKLSE